MWLSGSLESHQHELDDIERKLEALDRLLSVATKPPRWVPRPIGSASVEGASDADDAIWWGARRTCFAQRGVYARMPVGNAPRWFECAICADYKFSSADAATQHTPLHPPVCSACLSKLAWCPFCREWIGNETARRLCLRLLGRRNVVVLVERTT